MSETNSERRTSAPPAPLVHVERAQLPDGRWLEAGHLVKVRGERGTFKVQWHEPNGAVTCYGGTSGRERMRTFRPDRIGERKRQPKG